MESIYQRRLSIACRRLTNHVMVTRESDTLESVMAFLGTLTQDSVPYDNPELLTEMYTDAGLPTGEALDHKDMASALCQSFLRDLWEYHQTGLREYHNVTMDRLPE